MHQHGVQYMEDEVDKTPPLPPWEKTFMERLQESGYYTAAVGKIHMIQPKGYHYTALTGGKGARWIKATGQDIGPAPLGQQYAEWLEKKHTGGYEKIYEQRRKPEYFDEETAVINTLPEEEYIETWITEEAKKFLKDREKKSGPFFLWVGFCGPHGPFDPPARYASMYNPEDMPLPRTFSVEKSTNPEKEIRTVRKRIAYYHAMMSCIDEKVGEIMQNLKNCGQDKNTIIIFTSDHGEMLGDKNKWGKCNFYEPVLRIPTIIYHPLLKQPFRFDGLVETFSLAPTVLDFCGVEKYMGMSAESLSPVIFNKREKGKECILSEYVDNERKHYGICIRTSESKLIVSTSGEHQLYKLNDDPLETKNLYYDATYRDLRESLKDILVDKLLKSSVPPYQSWLYQLPQAVIKGKNI
jgi:arylsulfatase